MKTFEVFRPAVKTKTSIRFKKHIDTVFFDDNCDREYVRESLINHDGYPLDIVLVEKK